MLYLENLEHTGSLYLVLVCHTGSMQKAYYSTTIPNTTTVSTFNRNTGTVYCVPVAMGDSIYLSFEFLWRLYPLLDCLPYSRVRRVAQVLYYY